MQSIIYCIPILTADFESFMEKIHLISKEKVILINERLFQTETGTFYDIEIDPYMSELKEAFYYSRNSEVNQSFIKEIDAHKSILYLISDSNNILESIDIVQILLLAGGIAIKNEITGKTFTKAKWNKLFLEKNSDHICEFFTNVLFDEESIYSVGMNVFGFPDIQINTRNPTDEEIEIINETNIKTLSQINFRLKDDIRFMKKSKDKRFTKDDISYNSNGVIIIKAK